MPRTHSAGAKAAASKKKNERSAKKAAHDERLHAVAKERSEINAAPRRAAQKLPPLPSTAAARHAAAKAAAAAVAHLKNKFKYVYLKVVNGTAYWLGQVKVGGVIHATQLFPLDQQRQCYAAVMVLRREVGHVARGPKKSKHPGVTWNPNVNKWCARTLISAVGYRKTLGYFDDEDAAGKAVRDYRA